MEKHVMLEKTVNMKSNVGAHFRSMETMEMDQTIESAPIRREDPLSKTAQAKKIWIDIDNSPHVPFFLPIIEELQSRGFEVILTARDIYQVRDLLELYDLPCQVIGGHWGKNKILKVLVNVKRVLQLIPTAYKARPDLAISHGSRAQVLTCKALGIPTVMMHDYEHSIKTGFLEPDWTFMPDIMPDGAMSRNASRTLKYPGIKEDVYVPRFRPDASVFGQLGVSPDQLIVTLRPPATEAHYHNPESEILFEATVRLLAQNSNVRAITLPRNAAQGKLLQKQWSDLIASGRMIIPKGPLDGLNLIWFSDLVISGGGTMNREASALGVPVYSIFRGKIGAVDQYLVENGRLTLLENIEDVQTKIVLRRRNRPSMLENSDRPALDCIINKIVSIVEDQHR
jgi:predicted glycosyltransferase